MLFSKSISILGTGLRTVLLGLCFGLGFSLNVIAAKKKFSSATSFFQEEAAVLKQIAGQRMPALNPEELPQLFRSLETVLKEKLEPAANRVIAGENDPTQLILKLLITDTPVVNAHVIYGDPREGKKVAYVILNTGMIDHLIRDAGGAITEDSLRSGIGKTIPGVMAHELGHYFDDADPVQQDQDFKKMATDLQGVEVRADFMGAQILREAKLPEEGLFEAFASFKHLPESVGNSQDSDLSKTRFAYLSTHPSDSLRMTEQEFAVTLNRFQKGAPALEPVEVPALASLQSEIRKIAPPKDRSWFSHSDDSIQFLLKRIDKINEKNQVFNEDSLHLKLENAALTEVDEILARIDRIVRDGRESFTPELADDYLRIIKDINVATKSDKLNAHLRELHTHSLISDPVLQKAIRENFGAALAVGYNLQGEASLARYLGLDTQTLLSWYGDEMAQMPMKNLSNLTSFLSRTSDSLHDQLLSTAFIHQHLLDKTADAKAEFFIEPAAKPRFSSYFAVSPPSDLILFASSYDQNISKELAALVSTRAPAEQFVLLKDIATKIWANRGEYALLDLLKNNHNAGLDWSMIFKILDVPPSEGFLALNRSLLEYSKSAQFEQNRVWFGKAIADLSAPASEALKPRPWLDQSTLRIIEARLLEGQPPKTQGFMRYALGRANPHPFRKFYAEKLKGILSAHGRNPLEYPTLQTMHDSIVAEYFKIPGESPSPADSHLKQSAYAGVDQILAKHIAESALEPAVKTGLLSQIFLDPTLFSGGKGPLFDLYRVSPYSSDEILWPHGGIKSTRILDALAQSSLIATPSALLAILANDPRAPAPEIKKTPSYSAQTATQTSGPNQLSSITVGRSATPAVVLRGTSIKWYYRLIHEFGDGLQKELRKISTKADLNIFADRVFSRASYPFDSELIEKPFSINSPNTYRLMRSIIDKSEKLDLTLQEKISLFRSLSHGGGSTASDQYFEKHLLAPLGHRPGVLKFLATQVGGSGLPVIADATLLAKVARKAIAASTQKALRIPGSEAALSRLLAELNAIAPSPSIEKDSLLEELAWKLEISDPKLLAQIQELKSANWRLYNRATVRRGSALVTFAESLSLGERRDLIGYLLDPENGMAEHLVKSIEQNVNENGHGYAHEGHLKTAAEFENLENFARTATTIERAFAISSILPLGTEPLFDRALPNLKQLRKLFGYVPNSLEEKILLAYLNTVPEIERITTLGYLLSLSKSGTEKGNIRPIFEIFRTVGIRAGQLASVFNLFGSKTSADLKQLKDHAEVLDRSEIEDALRQRFSAEEREKIKLTEIVGSASNKVVVAAEYHSGAPHEKPEEIVIMLRRSHAKEQVARSIITARAFLNELVKTGTKLPKAFMDAMIDGIERQLPEELDFRMEIPKIKEAVESYRDINLKSPDGWHFEVPEVFSKLPSDEAFLVLRRAHGVSVGEVKDEVSRKQIGRMVVEAASKIRFGLKMGSVDPHAGNFLINAETKTIYPIDFGQSVRLTSSERYNVAQLLRAFEAKNPHAIANYGLALAETPPAKRSRLAVAISRDIDQELKTHASDNPEKALGAIVGIFKSHEAPLDNKISFGIMKELLYLGKEWSVSSQELTDILKPHIKAAIVNEPRLTVLRDVTRTCATMLQSLFPLSPKKR